MLRLWERVQLPRTFGRIVELLRHVDRNDHICFAMDVENGSSHIARGPDRRGLGVGETGIEIGDNVGIRQ